MHRDRVFIRGLLLGLLALVMLYTLLDFCGWLPEAVSVAWHTKARRHRSTDSSYGYGHEYDPNLVLGVAIGDTRYRFNHAERFALVMRPLFGVTHWRIPETVDYEGTTYTVTSLDTFALLHALTVQEVYLPKTLRYFNQAPAIASKTIQQITVGDVYSAPPQTFDIPQARRALGLDPTEEHPIAEGTTP